MMPKIDKKAERIREIFNKSRTKSRAQWEYINQKGYDFSNDNQLTEQERLALEQQGMPTFTINRIVPVVEMLNFYATAQNPRWQAVGAEGSDIDVAAVFSDLADYIWHQSDGSCKYANAINDAITKSLGYLVVTVDQDADNGMGEVKIEQPDPFDVFVDPKSRDIMFRDAAYILIRKLLPKQHLMKQYPQHARKIKNAVGESANDFSYTERAMDSLQKDFHYKDIGESESIDPDTGEHDQLIEFYEFYEKVKIPYMNVFYRIPPSEEQLSQIKEQVKVRMMEMQKEMQVELLEQQQEMQGAVEAGEMLPERFQLEMEKAQQMMQQQLAQAEQQYMSELQSEMSKIENAVVTEKQFKVMMDHKPFAESLIDKVKFYGNRIKISVVVGNKILFERILPEKITNYPIVPFHFKWTGTPFPISAVSPLIGKQMELNKAHQIMVHNASLGSSLRWMHEEGSIDTDHWEQYSSSPGALLPIRPGATPPTPVQPAPLSNAFFQIVQEGKHDMEYLAGIYGAMQGDVGAQHDTYRGMLAMDEYGTRRIKQWMKNSIETALMQLGEVVMQFSQSIYTAHKVFRIVQPSALQEQRQVELNIPMYNDYGQVIGKFNDLEVAKFDIRIIAGSTLPVNRWAYLDELKQLMQLGVIDDIALLAETDIRNKEQIAKRKSVYSQLQGQLQGAQGQIKDLSGTIETLERQLVQAGIKNKVMQASVEINKKKEEVKGDLESTKTQASAQLDDLSAQAQRNEEQRESRNAILQDRVNEAINAKQKESLTQE
jgi:hypothetical protein